MPTRIKTAIQEAFAPDAVVRLGHPMGEVRGAEALWDAVYAPLLAALPDLERADFILMAGPRWRGMGDWIGIGGHFMGSFRAPWLGIPAAGHPVYFRYHEYLRLEEGQIVEMEALWDIPQLMQQAGAWPMAPQLGVGMDVPRSVHGHDGVITAPFDAAQADASVQACLGHAP